MPADLTNCDMEPIHVPGAIQGPGVVIVSTDGEIRAVSENVADLTSTDVDDLLGSTVDALPPAIRALVDTVPDVDGLPTVGRGYGWRFRAHRSGADVVIEAEPDAGAEEPEELLHRLSLLTAAVEQAGDLASTRTAICEAVRSLTGFDRVMVYLFHDDGHGEVVAEATAAGVESFLGLHYPATDIPRQARRLYVVNQVRQIPHVRQPALALVGRDDPLVDLTHSTLRAVSPIHLQYLQNMGVAASLSLALVDDGALTGLIACHHESPRRLSGPTRDACQVLARLLSDQLRQARAGRDDEIKAAKLGAQFLLLRHLATGADVASTLSSAVNDLRRLLDAEGILIRSGDVEVRDGEIPDEPVIDGLLTVNTEPLWDTDEIPPVLGHPGGVMIGRFSGGVILWFRREMTSEIRWGGDPTEGIQAGTKALSPRASFEAFTQIVRGRCTPWTATDRALGATIRHALQIGPAQGDAAATDFDLVMESLVRYATDLEMVNIDLTTVNRDLENVAYVLSHDLRSPLRSIRAYLELYREDVAAEQVDLPEPATESLTVIEEATVTMQQLLDGLLEWSRVGTGTLTTREDVDLADVVAAVLRELRVPMDTAGAQVTVGPLPSVPGDARMLRQVVTNLLDNAVKFRDPARPLRVQITADVGESVVEVKVADNGVGIPEMAKHKVFGMFDRATAASTPGIGAGLAIVHRVMERHRGTITVESAEGIGTTFTISLPLRHPSEAEGTPVNSEVPAT